MDYEKLYKEALEKAKEWHKKGYGHGCQEVIENLFPELKEGDDERIRKYLIYHYQGDGCLCNNKYRIDYKEIRAWLEKQGEQKYTQRDIDDAYLKGIADVKREVEKIDEQTEKMKKEIAEFIFNSKEDIKQRYEWIKCLGFDVEFSNKEKQDEQKHAWSEEDEACYTSIIEHLKHSITNGKPETYTSGRLTDWIDNRVKSLRPQNRWKPSLSQLNALGVVVKGNAPDDIEEIKSLYNELKKL